MGPLRFGKHQIRALVSSASTSAYTASMGSRSSRVCASLVRNSRFDAGVDTPTSGQPGAMICVPLRLRKEWVGVLRAFLGKGCEASPRTAEVLGAVFSAALRNVLLYRSLLQSIEEVAEARKNARG